MIFEASRLAVLIGRIRSQSIRQDIFGILHNSILTVPPDLFACAEKVWPCETTPQAIKNHLLEMKPE